MNSAQRYIPGSYKARLLPDGSITYYREILTPDGRELIGREYPNEGYCWLNDAYIAARLAELEPAA
jgi:hypothetical protein